MCSRPHGSRSSARPLAASQIADLLLARRLRMNALRVRPGEETFRDLTFIARPRRARRFQRPRPSAPCPVRDLSELGSRTDLIRTVARWKRGLRPSLLSAVAGLTVAGSAFAATP